MRYISGPLTTGYEQYEFNVLHRNGQPSWRTVYVAGTASPVLLIMHTESMIRAIKIAYLALIPP